MRFGLPEDIITKLSEVFEANPKVDKAFIFGSRAKGNYRPDSDIDIAIKGAEITLDDILKMQVAFEEKGINFKIDLVHYDTIKEKALKEHIERVAMVMYSRWNEFKLQEITEPLKDVYQPNRNDDFKYVGLEHIQPETLRLDSVGVSSDVTSNKFRFRKGDVLFGKLRPYFRKVVRPEFDGICSTDIWVFRAKNGFDQSFLFYFLANWDFVNTADGAESGTRMPRADWNFLKDTIWNIPPHPEQAAISEILSSLDDKIDLLHRQNKTLEQLAETLFRKWFVEGAEESWEKRSLDNIAEFLNGLACQKFPPQNNEVGLPVIKIKEMKNGITESSDFATSNVPQKYIVQNGDLLFSWSGSLDVVLWFGGNGVLNQHLFKVTSHEFPQWFCYFWIKYHLEEFKGIAEDKSTTMGHIQRHHLSQAKVLIPNNEDLKNMNEVISPVFQKLKLNQIQIQTLTKLRDTLLPKLLNGEVRVELS